MGHQEDLDHQDWREALVKGDRKDIREIVENKDRSEKRDLSEALVLQESRDLLEMKASLVLAVGLVERETQVTME